MTIRNKWKILSEYPKKVEIKGGHSDVNRMLKDRDLKEIYKDSDETHHQNKKT